MTQHEGAGAVEGDAGIAEARTSSDAPTEPTDRPRPLPPMWTWTRPTLRRAVEAGGRRRARRLERPPRLDGGEDVVDAGPATTIPTSTTGTARTTTPARTRRPTGCLERSSWPGPADRLAHLEREGEVCRGLPRAASISRRTPDRVEPTGTSGDTRPTRARCAWSWPDGSGLRTPDARHGSRTKRPVRRNADRRCWMSKAGRGEASPTLVDQARSAIEGQVLRVGRVLGADDRVRAQVVHDEVAAAGWSASPRAPSLPRYVVIHPA